MIAIARDFVDARYRGVALALVIAAGARFLSEHYGAPAMLFALLIGMAFNFLAQEGNCAAGIEFASKTLLRLGVALLGFRLAFADIAELGLRPVIGVLVLVALTIGAGIAIAPLLGRRWRFGLLTGGAVAICGASAALALAAVLPKRVDLERDTLFTVVGVTTLSTIAMIGYPILFATLGLDDREIGFLIGATIHDVAQVVGAGYSVSDTAGDIATYVKLQRVALLPVVLLIVVFAAGRGERKGIGLPWFVVAFIALMLVNNTGPVPDVVRAMATETSQWLLLTTISALGVKTAIKAMLALGPRHALVIVGETLLLLGAGLVFVFVWFR